MRNWIKLNKKYNNLDNDINNNEIFSNYNNLQFHNKLIKILGAANHKK